MSHIISISKKCLSTILAVTVVSTSAFLASTEANAAITAYSFRPWLTASTLNEPPIAPNVVDYSNPTSYTNTISDTGYIRWDAPVGYTTYTEATASANISYQADLANGSFLASGSITSDVVHDYYNATAGHASSGFELFFTAESDYAYTLNVATSDTYYFRQLYSDNENLDISYAYAGSAPTHFSYTGTLRAGSNMHLLLDLYNLGVQTSGNYTLSLNLTPAPAPATVPVPAAAWLMGSGLLGLIGVARRHAA